MSAADQSAQRGRGSRRPRATVGDDPLGGDADLRNLLAAATPHGGRPVLASPAPPAQPAPPPAEPHPGGGLAVVTAQGGATAATEPASPAASLTGPAPDTYPMLAGTPTGQATVAVSVDVAARFRRLQKQLTGSDGQRPSNGEIVFAALNASQGRYSEIVAARQPKPKAGQLFGAPLPGRRPTSGATPSQQLSFRPTQDEKALIAQLARDSGAASMAAFLTAVLDDYLTAQGFPPGRAGSHR